MSNISNFAKSLENKDMIQCPYDKFHFVKSKGLKQHLQKCKLHYSHLNLIECEYNMMHVIAKNEKAIHEFLCPNRPVGI